LNSHPVSFPGCVGLSSPVFTRASTFRRCADRYRMRHVLSHASTHDSHASTIPRSPPVSNCSGETVVSAVHRALAPPMSRCAVIHGRCQPDGARPAVGTVGFSMASRSGRVGLTPRSISEPPSKSGSQRGIGPFDERTPKFVELETAQQVAAHQLGVRGFPCSWMVVISSPSVWSSSRARAGGSMRAALSYTALAGRRTGRRSSPPPRYVPRASPSRGG